MIRSSAASNTGGWCRPTTVAEAFSSTQAILNSETAQTSANTADLLGCQSLVSETVALLTSLLIAQNSYTIGYTSRSGIYIKLSVFGGNNTRKKKTRRCHTRQDVVGGLRQCLHTLCGVYWSIFQGLLSTAISAVVVSASRRAKPPSPPSASHSLWNGWSCM